MIIGEIDFNHFFCFCVCFVFCEGISKHPKTFNLIKRNLSIVNDFFVAVWHIAENLFCVKLNINC